MASTYLSYTIATDGNKKLYTWSAWVKFSDGNTNCDVFHAGTDGNHNSFIRRISTGQLDIGTYNGYSSGWQYRLLTNRLFRDTNAWYHIVVRQDTDNSTADDRVRLYVNGVQETSFATRTNPSSGYEGQINNNLIHTLGRGIESGTSSNYRYHNGLISHVHFCDGYSYAPTEFGETDSTTGEWKIKTSPSVSYGTNGFFWLKDSIATTDHSPNSNTFTVGGGTLTKTEDCPSNVFATMNVLTLSASQVNINKGNLSKTNTPTSNAWRSFYGTIGASSGKYYWELKIDNIESSDPNNFRFGVIDAEQMKNEASNNSFHNESRGYAYNAQNGNKGNNGSFTSYGNSFTTGDIIGCAVDLDNHKIYWSKNGTWQNSGDPTSGSTGTGSAFDLASGYTYLPVIAQYYGNEHFSLNFGNGYFGTTAVSSAGTNASGIGIFEYDVPTNYRAWSTKGLNE